jgi:hypothetical protein
MYTEPQMRHGCGSRVHMRHTHSLSQLPCIYIATYFHRRIQINVGRRL